MRFSPSPGGVHDEADLNYSYLDLLSGEEEEEEEEEEKDDEGGDKDDFGDLDDYYVEHPEVRTKYLITGGYGEMLR